MSKVKGEIKACVDKIKKFRRNLDRADKTRRIAAMKLCKEKQNLDRLLQQNPKEDTGQFDDYRPSSPYGLDGPPQLDLS